MEMRVVVLDAGSALAERFTLAFSAEPVSLEGDRSQGDAC
jgi:hypothetical protein